MSIPLCADRARLRALSLMFTAALLSACGGGGGGGTDAAASPPPTSGAGGVPTPTRIARIVDSPDAFLFNVDDRTDTRTALADKAGGPVYAAWNPAQSTELTAQGVKVTFFGHPAGCDSTISNGPVSTVGGATLAEALQHSGLSTTTSKGPTWVPSANVAGCDSGGRGRRGPSVVHVVPGRGLAGQVLMSTVTGPRADGLPSFFAPFGASGQYGAGENANISGTFVQFRRNWRDADPLQPWTASGGRAPVARVLAVQSVGRLQVSEAPTGETLQAKQQLAVTFINTACARGGITRERACQVNYLFNTAIARSGVTDWSTVPWFQNAKVWFDPGQGGIPIVEGRVGLAGTVTREDDSGLALYSSRGQATRHGTFRSSTFDLRITFTQLANALRITRARQLDMPSSSVSDAQIAAVWGERWNDPSAWATLTVTTGQEVFNPTADRAVSITGGFRRVFVGPVR